MRALHVFRDQTSLAASPELWPAIEHALNESTHLLLLASPAAANSRWVAREIEWWLANRSASTMLVLLTDGELAWDEASADFDWNRTTSLPRDVLTGRLHGEPLWVDLRWARSSEVLSLRNARFRSAVLDIAAPLHGKDKDALDGDDVRAFARLQRIRRAAIAGLATLTVAAVVAATVAVRQRDEAVKQNAIAQAGRLAAQADLLREGPGNADLSTMLAAEAVSTLYRIGDRSSEADLTLRRSLAGLPQYLGEVELRSTNITLDPSGAILSVDVGDGELVALHLPDGKPAGCQQSDIQKPVDGDTAHSFRSVKAMSADAAWCVVVQHGAGRDLAFERWTSSPVRRVEQFRTPTRAIWVRPFISDDGDLIALEDNAQTGDESQSIVRLLRRSRDTVLITIAGEKFHGFSPDHRHFATTKSLWRVSDSAASPPARVLNWGAKVGSVVFSKSGAYVAFNGVELLEIWDVRAGTKLRTSPALDAVLLAIRDDGRFLAVRRADTTRVLDALTDTVVTAVPLGAEAAAFGTRDPTIIEAFLKGGTRHGRVLRLPVSGAAMAGSELPPGATPHTMAIHDNVVDVLYSADSVTRLARWSIESGQWSELFVRPRATTIAASADRSVVVAMHENIATVGRTDGSGLARDIVLPGPASLVALSFDGAYLVGSVNDTMYVVNVRKGTSVRVPLPSAPLAIHVSTDGAYAAAIYEHDMAVRAGPEYRLVRWSLTSPFDSISMSLGHSLAPIASTCMISADERSVVFRGVRAAFGDTGVRAGSRDTLPDECTQAYRPALRLREGTTQLVVADTSSGNTIAIIEQPRSIRLAAARADGRRVSTIDDLGAMRVFAIDVPSLLTQVCTRAPREFAESEWTRYLPPTATSDACGRVRPASSASLKAKSTPRE